MYFLLVSINFHKKVIEQMMIDHSMAQHEYHVILGYLLYLDTTEEYIGQQTYNEVNHCCCYF